MHKTIISCVILIFASLLLGSCAPAPAAPTSMPSPMTITYLCNAGFILDVGDQKILVDALFQREDFCGAEMTRMMREGLAPIDGADLVLASHNHSDHFDAQVVGEYLARNPGAVLVAEGDAFDALAQGYGGYEEIKDRITGVRLAIGEWTALSLEGIELALVNAPDKTPNLACLIRAGGKAFFHTGDMLITDKITAAFQVGGLPEAGIDFALVPFTWFIDPGGPKFMAKAIGAQEFIPMHYIDSNPEEISTLFHSAFPEVILLFEPLEFITR
jgi:L-ascorbate metabolism protein UlaG (beta-lactamase superfamily)